MSLGVCRSRLASADQGVTTLPFSVTLFPDCHFNPAVFSRPSGVSLPSGLVLGATGLAFPHPFVVSLPSSIAETAHDRHFLQPEFAQKDMLSCFPCGGPCIGSGRGRDQRTGLELRHPQTCFLNCTRHQGFC